MIGLQCLLLLIFEYKQFLRELPEQPVILRDAMSLTTGIPSYNLLEEFNG